MQGAVAGLDIAPPAELAVGIGNAFALAGYCYHPGGRIRSLEISVGDTRTKVDRHGLPRIDVYESATGDAQRRALHSGFVATPRVEELAAPRTLEIRALLTLAGGHQEAVPLGSMEALPRLPVPAEAQGISVPPGDAPLVAICMATYNAPGELLRRQLDSIREQTHDRWICLISDESTDEGAYKELRAQVDGDPRFVVSRNDRHLGYYGNFERALSMAPPSADFVALCDQDDRWHPDKLERLIEAIGDSLLVYSDARVVDPSGDLVSPSYWINRRNNYTNYASLLLANSVTGAASLFRRELLDDALPLPAPHYKAFHDWWLAMVALSLGKIAYVEDPLYDYVQHGTAVIGHSGANRKPKRARVHLMYRLSNPGKGSRRAYYYNWQQQRVSAEVLRLRYWDRMPRAKRRTVARIATADRRASGLAWLIGRRTRRLWGHDETLDRELLYAYALGRRRAVSLWTAGRRRPNRVLPRDQSVPGAPAD